MKKFQITVLDTSAPIVDAVLANLTEVPILGTSLKALKFKDAVVDHILQAKVTAFFKELDQHSQESIETMIEKARDPVEGPRVAETVLLSLNSFTAISKCDMLGKLFVAYLEKKISALDLRRLAGAIDAATPEDLQAFLEIVIVDGVEYIEPLEHLTRSGLVKIKPGQGSIGFPNHPVYDVTQLGHTLRRLFPSKALIEAIVQSEEWRRTGHAPVSSANDR